MPSANHITCYKKAKRYTGRVTHVRERTAQPQPNNIPGLYKRYVMVYLLGIGFNQLNMRSAGRFVTLASPLVRRVS